MNQCEKVMLDQMVDEMNEYHFWKGQEDTNEAEACISRIMLLVDCVRKWREPVTVPVESGCGKLVSKSE